MRGNTPNRETSQVEINRATPHHLDLIIEILEEAGSWLRSKGIDSPWQIPGYFSRSEFTARILAGEVYLIMFKDQPAGTITLQQKDEVFWGPMPMDTIYIHKFAVKREYSGRWIGEKALEWSEEYARSLNKDFLRLDCLATNPEIRRYYERKGFIHVKDVQRSRWTASLYEKRIGKQD